MCTSISTSFSEMAVDFALVWLTGLVWFVVGGTLLAMGEYAGYWPVDGFRSPCDSDPIPMIGEVAGSRGLLGLGKLISSLTTVGPEVFVEGAT